MTAAIDLGGMVTVITGASRGIGAATARIFAEAGSNVVLAARGKAALDLLAAELGQLGVGTLVVPTDVTDPAATQALITQTINTFGRLDYAVNNAGGGFTGKISIADLTLEQYRSGMDLNLTSVFLCLKYEIPAMVQGGGGAIVNISSGSGYRASPGMGPYTIAKHGLHGLTKLAALDYATQRVRINALAPGPIMAGPLADLSDDFRAAAAQSVPMRTLGQPEDVARAALWLCSDAAQFITGATLPVDGGQLAS